MKADIHPTTHPVVFVDTSSGVEFVTTSTLTGEGTRDINGVAHQVINIEISSASHPFYTGKQVFIDTARRVEKFQEKMAKVEAAAEKRKGKKAKRAAQAAAKTDEETPKTEKKEATPAAETKTEAPTTEAPESQPETTEESK